MDLLQYNVYERDTKNAAGKAKKDVCHILERNNFRYFYRPSHHRLIRVVQQLFAISSLKKGQILFVQYPANIRLCYRYLSTFKSVRKLCIIHDLESLRGTLSPAEEISLLGMFDYIISHNAKMTSYLREQGLKTPVIDLSIFDYLMNENFDVVECHDKNIVAFAGNLQKSQFIYHLCDIPNVRFALYGVKPDGLDSALRPRSVEYGGAFSSEEVVKKLCGGWGLVWDGNSLDGCDGVNGQYLKYNCPHKTSMYIVAERPVIIWSQAAMADYILKKRLGIVVDNLNGIGDCIAKVSNEEYREMLENVKDEKKRLVAGQSLQNVLNQMLANL